MLHESKLLTCTGEVVGSLSFPIGHGENTFRKVASVRSLYQSSDAENISSYTLQRKVSCFHLYQGMLMISQATITYIVISLLIYEM